MARRPRARVASFPAALFGAIAAGALPSLAAASPESVVTSALDRDDRFDLQLRLDYDFVARRSAVRRERIDPARQPGDPIQIVRDLVYASSQHRLTPSLELGIFHDTWISAALPIVVTDQRTLSFDQRDTPCAFGATLRCINRSNSSTIADGILPTNGFDARAPDRGFNDPDDERIFRGPDRHGIDQLHLGLGVAPMNQQRDATKPTWKLGAELRLGIGAPARLDRADPDRETGVGSGVDELRLWTTVARRRGWAEPSIGVWWQGPINTRDESAFQDLGFGARVTDKQQQAGVAFTLEAIAVDRPEDGQRVSVDLGAYLVGHFEGRAYTEMWEVFAVAGDAASNGPLVLDKNPLTTEVEALSHPGISNVENYLELGGHVALRAELGPWVHIAATAQVTTETLHTITFADAGVDLPQCGSSSSGCENASDDVVTPHTAEVNPTYVDKVDLVGHRYLIDDVRNFTVGVEARVLF